MKPLFCMIRRRSDNLFSDGQTPAPGFGDFRGGRIWSHTKFAKSHCQGLRDAAVYVDCDVVSFGEHNAELCSEPFGAAAQDVWDRTKAKAEQRKRFQRDVKTFKSDYIDKGRNSR